MFSGNLSLAGALEEYGRLLDMQGAERYLVRTYRRAARSVLTASFDVVNDTLGGGDPRRLHGVGPYLSSQIRGFAFQGDLPGIHELREKSPAGLADLIRVPGLRPRHVRILYEKLGIQNLEDLRQASNEGRLAGLKGIGRRAQEEVREALSTIGASIPFRRAEVLALLPELLARIQALPGVLLVHLAGSVRRRKDTVRNLDVVLVLPEDGTLAESLADLQGPPLSLGADGRRATLRLPSGLSVAFLATDIPGQGAALLSQTGSAGHVRRLQELAVRLGAELSDQGFFLHGERQGFDERAIYAALGLDFVEPELREDQGEIDAAAAHGLPALLSRDNLQGDLHSHTDATDGVDTLERMADAAAELGLRYLAITDHTQSLKVANGQDELRLLDQIRAIDRLNGKLKGLTLLKSAEVDILEDGSLDLPDALLRELDLTVCSVHSKFTLPPEIQTQRVLRAMEHPSFRILGHPTGRLLLRRRGHPYDVEQVIRKAAELRRVLELNGQPDRLDLDAWGCRRAKALGVPISISSDAHSIREFRNLAFGIDQARRGGLEAGDVLNCQSLTDLRKALAS